MDDESIYSDSGAINTSDNTQSDNSFNNRSGSVSVYSAEEQIIQQRGRRSPKKKSLNEQHLSELNFQHLQHIPASRNLFLNIKQVCMRSPDPKQQQKFNQLNSSIESTSDGNICNTSNYSVRRKSLLRTPVKRRLRRHVGVLPKLRKSDKRRK